MPNLQSLFQSALVGAACLLLSGCSTTTTTIRLSGTPGATFSGHYRAGSTSFDVSGAIPLVVEVPGTSLRDCEFRKADAKTTMTLEISRGKKLILQGTAEPGTLGIRAKDDGGIRFQIIR